MSLSNLNTFTETDLKKSLPSIEKTFIDGKTMIELLTDYFVKNGQIKQQDIPEITSKGGIHGIPQLYKVVIDHWSVDLFASFCRKSYGLLDKSKARGQAESLYVMARDYYYNQYHKYEYYWPYQSASLDSFHNKLYRGMDNFNTLAEQAKHYAESIQDHSADDLYKQDKFLTSAKNDMIEEYLLTTYELTPTLRDIKGVDFYTKDGRGFDLKNSKSLTKKYEEKLTQEYMCSLKDAYQIVESDPTKYIESMQVLMSNQGAARFDANDRLFLVDGPTWDSPEEIKAKLDTIDFNHLTNFKTVNFTFGNKQYQSKCALFFL